MEALFAALMQRKQNKQPLPMLDIGSMTKPAANTAPQTGISDPSAPVGVIAPPSEDQAPPQTAQPAPATQPAMQMRQLQPTSMAGTMMKLYDLYNNTPQVPNMPAPTYDRASIYDRLFNEAKRYF